MNAGRGVHGAYGSCGCSGQTRIQAASKSRKAKVPVPMRTAMGARASSPRATMRTASPGRNPSSARRLTASAGARESVADTETTRADFPGSSSTSGISGVAGTMGGGCFDMNAILHENRSHYYYQITFRFLIVLCIQNHRRRMKCLRFLRK